MRRDDDLVTHSEFAKPGGQLKSGRTRRCHQDLRDSELIAKQPGTLSGKFTVAGDRTGTDRRRDVLKLMAENPRKGNWYRRGWILTRYPFSVSDMHVCEG